MSHCADWTKQIIAKPEHCCLKCDMACSVSEDQLGRHCGCTANADACAEGFSSCHLFRMRVAMQTLLHHTESTDLQ